MSELKFIYIDEDRVKNLLDWDLTFQAVETAIESVWKKRVVQNPRDHIKCSKTGTLLLTMPGYLNSEKFGALGCKMVTIGLNNATLEKPLPGLNANIFLFDEETGILKAIIGGTEITKWRTAAASAVATKYLASSKNLNGTLAILGAGAQGKIHAEAFHHFFAFKEIRIWNRTKSRAEKLVQDLNDHYKSDKFKYSETNEACVRSADVIITCTNASGPIVQLEWLKKGVHINAVGAGVIHHSELSESIYLSSEVYIDHWAGAETELSGLRKLGIDFRGEIGGLISKDLPPPSSNQLTVFQSLGMAVEDCAMGRLIYDLHKKQSGNC